MNEIACEYLGVSGSRRTIVRELPPIWVISLARATERRAFVDRAFAEVGLSFEIFAAVDGRALSARDLRQYSSLRANYYAGRDLERGMLACALSHLRVLERMVSEGIPELVVFEDDTRPLGDFRTMMQARDELPPNYDVVTFHSLFEWARPRPIAGRVLGQYQVCEYERTPMGTQAYLITCDAAQRVLAAGYPVALPPDELLYRPRPAALNVYGFVPSPVVHESYPSEVRAPMPPVVVPDFGRRAVLPAVRLAGRVGRRLQGGRPLRGPSELRRAGPESDGLAVTGDVGGGARTDT